MDEAGHVLEVGVETHEKERNSWWWTLLHLSHELQSCPSHGHTVTLLGLLAGGRGPIPAPSAIAGVVSRVGSLERSVEPEAGAAGVCGGQFGG